MKKFVTLLLGLLLSIAAFAQYDYHGYDYGRGHRHGRHRQQEVACTEDWQELWNGCHVRMKFDHIYICERDGDNVVWGDEVILLRNGNYNVRRGDTWRIYEEDGDWTFIYGDQILSWWNGTYCIKRSGTWRVYDDEGDWLGFVRSDDYIELLWNGCYLYKQGDTYYVADEEGDRIFSLWGDEIILLDNGLFRVKRNGWVRYYDKKGEERD